MNEMRENLVALPPPVWGVHERGLALPWDVQRSESVAGRELEGAKLVNQKYRLESHHPVG